MNIEKQEIEEKLNVKRLDKNKDIKIKFLQEQNSNLREQNKDLQENLKINKETFDLMLKNECSSQNIKIESKSILNKNLTDNMICYDETNNSHFQIKSLQKIIEKLFKENTKHLENINKLIIERNNAQTKAFINELISDQSQNNENELIADLRDRVLFLQKIVNQKDKFDQSRYDKKTDDIILCKVLIESPNEQLMKIFTELQATKNALSIIYRKYNRLKTEQKELLHLNYNLFLELNKLKEKILGVKPNENIHLDENSSIIAYYKEFLKETGEFSYDECELSPLNSPLPQKITFKNNIKFSKKSNIPKLDLTSAIKIQEANLQRINQLKNKDIISVTEQLEKIQKYENELLRIKKLWQSEIINHNRMKEECERAQKKKKIMAEKLETIINSQKQYEKKWEKIYRYLTFYREFYFKSIFIIYKNKLSHEFLDNENKLNELIGLESIQSRLNKEITKSPRLLLDISMNMIEMDFDLQKSIKNNNDDNLRKKEFFDDNEKNNNGNFNSHKDINESNRKNIFPYLDTFFQMDSAHINKLPFFDEVKIMQNQYPKRRLSKTQVFDCSPNYKILGEDKSENQNDKINELNKSQLFDYGKKMKIFVEKKIISPLSKSINEENDFKFISKNNIDFSTHKKQMNHNMIEEIFL